MQGVFGLVLNLIIDTSYSWIRMFLALGISVVIAFAIGIYMALSRTAERYLMPIIDVLQTVPILAFFPFAIYIIVGLLPGVIGINLAVIFLIITSMLWNIIFGVYESIKTLPEEFNELSKLYNMGFLQKIKKIFIPASLPRVVEQSMLSWSIGLFYLVSSEIFSTGNAEYSVKHGIGVAVTELAASGNTYGYIIALIIFLIFVIATRFLFFGPLESYVNKHRKGKPEKSSFFKEMKLRSIRRYERYAKKEERVLIRALSKIKFGMHKEQKAKISKSSRMHMIFYASFAVLLIFILLFITGLLNSEIMILEELAASILRVWVAFIAVSIVSILISVYIIFMAKNESRYITLFQILAAIPATILLPELVNLFGNGTYGPEIVAFLIFFLSGVWYMIFSMIGAGKTLQSNVFEVKRIFGVKGINSWKKIYVMALLPGIITGGITAIAAEWNASILAESFGSTHVTYGIGRFLDITLSNGNILLMGIALINLVVMIIIINKVLWKRLYDKASLVYK